MTKAELIGRLEAATGATRSDIPGLWNLPGYPELTLGQLQQIAAIKARNIENDNHEKTIPSE